MAQPNYATVQAHHDPPVHDDFADLLVPQQFMSGAGQQAHVKEESGLRWQIPSTIPGTTAADLPALPLDTIPFIMNLLSYDNTNTAIYNILATIKSMIKASPWSSSSIVHLVTQMKAIDWWKL